MKTKIFFLVSTLLLTIVSANATDSSSSSSSSSANLNFSRFIYVSSGEEIIYNGTSQGFGANLVVDKSDYAYEQLKNDGVHIIFNGKDVGLGQKPQITNGKILFETEKNLKNHIIFNGKDLGEGYDSIVKDGHVIFFKQIQSDAVRQVEQGLIFAFYDGKYYCDAKDKIKEKISMVGDNVICEQNIKTATTDKNFIVYNGKVIDEGFNPKISKKHYAYTKKKKLNDKEVDVLMLDGKELGEGNDIRLSEDAFIYFIKNFEGKEELVYNGKNLGVFKSKESIVFKDGHVAFLRDLTKTELQNDGTYKENTYTYVFYDGVNRGIGDIENKTGSLAKNIFLAKNHIAFERKVKAQELEATDQDADLSLDKNARTVASAKEAEYSYVVYDGRDLTKIEEGSLRMDDEGYFTFIKMLEEKVEDEEYTKARADYYAKNKDYGEEYTTIKKYIYKETPYIYKGSPDGSYEKLTTGLIDSIMLKDGHVVYLKEEKEERVYYENNEKRKRLELVNYVIIDGKNKGEGDLSSLVIHGDQYAFSKNEQGRKFFRINGEEQAISGESVAFLDPLSSQNTTRVNQVSDVAKTTGINIKGQISKGEIIKKGDIYYLQVAKKQVKLQVPNNIKIDDFLAKKVVVDGKYLITILPKSTKRVYVYQVYQIFLESELNNKTTNKTTTSKVSNTNEVNEANAQIYRGTLQFKNNIYYLKGVNRNYELSLSDESKKEELKSYINDVVKLKLVKKGTKNVWEVLEIKQ